jgi:hypothetical protein
MKNLSLLLLAILTVVFLILGNMYWQDRTDISTEKVDDSPVNETESVQKEKEPDTETDTASAFEEMTSKWPVNAREQFLQAVKSNETYKVAIVGSPSLGAESDGWSVQLQQELSETYGEQIDVKLFEFDTTSTEFINGSMSEEVTGYQPDLVLFEPFTLNDNTVGVAPADTAYSVNAFLTDLQGANEDVTLMLQPGHPLYEAVYYPQQVDELKAFAEENNLTYLDHWTEWPESDDEALQEYLTDTQDVPSEKGHELWADYLKDYFISE